MKTKAPVFEKTYQEYLKKIDLLDLHSLGKRMGLEWTGKDLLVPLFGRVYRISGQSILEPSGEEPDHAVKVVLSRYLMMYPETHLEDHTWVSYKDFEDAAPLANTFHLNTEMSIADKFTGKLQMLKKACFDLGGYEHSPELHYDLHIKFDVLPNISMLFLFNDADDEFPADSHLLFEKRAKNYLDMECLAILGALLAEKLQDI